MKRFAALVLVFCLLSAAPALAADWRPNAAGTLEWHGEDAAAYTGTYYMSSVMGLGFGMLRTAQQTRPRPGKRQELPAEPLQCRGLPLRRG